MQGETGLTANRQNNGSFTDASKESSGDESGNGFDRVMSKQLDESSRQEHYARKKFKLTPEQQRASLSREQKELIAAHRAQQQA